MSREIVLIDTGYKRLYEFEITRHDVVMRGLPDALVGTTFVHLSDFHGGYANTEPVYEEAIRRANSLEPEFVFFTGDYIDDRHGPRNYPIGDFLKRFRARQGVFGSFGNHDHRRGIVGTRRYLEQAGVRVLCNESIHLDSGLWLVGIDDLYEGRPNIDGAFANVPDDVTALTLSHNPRLVERVCDRDTVILAGHTHGGQIALPILTPKIMVWSHLRCRQVAGWYQDDRARIYVNRGVGVTGRPFRFRCPAEMAIFRMVRAEPNPPAPFPATFAALTGKGESQYSDSPSRFGRGWGG